MSFTVIYLQRTDSIPIDLVRLLYFINKRKVYLQVSYLTTLSASGLSSADDRMINECAVDGGMRILEVTGSRDGTTK
jgi:hypothetical protein